MASKAQYHDFFLLFCCFICPKNISVYYLNIYALENSIVKRKKKNEYLREQSIPLTLYYKTKSYIII